MELLYYELTGDGRFKPAGSERRDGYTTGALRIT